MVCPWSLVIPSWTHRPTIYLLQSFTLNWVLSDFLIMTVITYAVFYFRVEDFCLSTGRKIKFTISEFSKRISVCSLKSEHCVYMCVYPYVHIHKYTSIYTYIHTYPYIYTDMYMYTHSVWSYQIKVVYSLGSVTTSFRKSRQIWD